MVPRSPDHDEIVRVVQLYVDGFNDCDIDKFKEAFHESAWITYTNDEGALRNFLLTTCFEEWARPPRKHIVGRFLSVVQAGDVATVLLGFDNLADPSESWVDVHSLLRIDGVWKITNKTATHASRAAWAGAESLPGPNAPVTQASGTASEAAAYPGWHQYYAQVRRLVQGVNDDDIPVQSLQLTTPLPISKARLVEKLIEVVERVPVADRGPCSMPTKEELLKALTSPEGRNYDWRPWSAHWEGSWKDWTGSSEVQTSWDWLMPVPGRDGEFGVPVGGKARVTVQEFISRKSPSDNAVEARLWNISDDESGLVRGWAPGGLGAEWTKAVWIAFPFVHGPCKCIIWLSTKGAELQCLSETPKYLFHVGLDGHAKVKATGPARS